MKINKKQKNIAFFDLDGTIIEGQSQKYLIKYLYRRKYINFFDFLHIISWFVGYRLHFVNNPLEIMKIAFEKILKGKDIEASKSILINFCNEKLSSKVKNKMKDKIEEHRKSGDRIILMTNAIEPLAMAMANILNIDEVVATKLERNKDCYTGKIAGGIIYGKQKLILANKILEKEGKNTESWAYADHKSDIYLLERVNHAFLVDPDKKTKKFYKETYENKNSFGII